MKSAILSCLLPALVFGAAVPLGSNTIEPRDDPPKLETDNPNIQLGSGVPLRRAYKVEEIPPKSNIPGAKRLKFIYGPFKVRGSHPYDPAKVPDSAYSMDKGGTAFNFQLADDFPKDVTVLLATSQLLKKDMTPAKLDDKIYNHHTAFMEASPPMDYFACANSSIKAKQPAPINIFMGATTEKVDYDFIAKNPTLKTGFYISKTAFLQGMVDLVNFGATDLFYSEGQLEFLPGLPKGYLKTKQTMINPDICGGSDGYALAPPKGQQKFQVETQGILVQQPGWLTRERGHLHDGGTHMVLLVNDKLVCKSDALYGGPTATFVGDDGKTFETINESTECDTPIKLNKGDRIKLTAYFDLDKHPSRPMGASSSEGASGKPMAGHGNMKLIQTSLDGETAEQMAVMFVNFAATDN